MYGIAEGLPGLLTRVCACLGLLFALFAAPANAAQIDIHGPSGSVAFGTSVTVLPNGNIVVTDPTGPYAAIPIGAVYLYDPNGNLISTLTGSSSNDNVGSGGVKVVGNGNFVVMSPNCKINGATKAGAVTWMNGSTGLGPNAVVSSLNSLVGSTANDQVGLLGAAVLSNGNYVVRSPAWSNGGAGTSYFGAATWGDGNSGISGPVSANNSLIGAASGDGVGLDLTTLSGNGNYVVPSQSWHCAPGNTCGAVTWGNGLGGTHGLVSTNNSLTGSINGDYVGTAVVALTNGNYVVDSPQWQNPYQNFGAVTWGNGTSGTTGPVSSSNSLVGDVANDSVGQGGVIPLTNGNYVVASPHWSNNSQNDAVGAATWGNGLGGTIGSLTSGNSLIGTTVSDQVGASATALSNGNYVVTSPNWNNQIGAVTWGNGTVGTSGPVLPGNSLIGTTSGDNNVTMSGDYVGSGGVIALSNGNYVVDSPTWNNGTNNPVGAVTWVNSTGLKTGTVMTSNSLFGTASSDTVGNGGVYALSNGNYVVASALWNNEAGAVTWGNGSTGTTGPVLPSNSLVGTTSGDSIGNNGIVALSNGNYVVSSPYWYNNGNSHAGAMTWGNGNSGGTGAVSAANSLVGTTTNDKVSYQNAHPLSDGNYIVLSSLWSNGAFTAAGAVTLASSSFRLKGTIQAWNSVRGFADNGGNGMVNAGDVFPTVNSYDATRHRLAVGRPSENIVSLFTMDQIFASDLDP